MDYDDDKPKKGKRGRKPGSKNKASKETQIQRIDRMMREGEADAVAKRQVVIDRLKGAKDQEAMRVKREIFLAAIAEGHSIKTACHVACLQRQTHLNWVKDDPEYKLAFEHAQEDGADELEEQLKIRATSSDLLLMFALKGRRPHIYRDSHKIDVDVSHKVTVGFDARFGDFMSKLKEAHETIEREKQRQLEQDGEGSKPSSRMIDVTPTKQGGA